MKAKVIIGANLGDEGKGTIVAHYAKEATGKVLNVLTNGGAQRAHSILTEQGSFTFQHFGSGTCHKADSYYSQFFILNPMQFVQEFDELYGMRVIDADKKMYRHPDCMWSTPYDMMANQILEDARGDSKHGSCGMGIWETIKRYNNNLTLSFDSFISLDYDKKVDYIKSIRNYYDRIINISELKSPWKEIWSDDAMIVHFIADCQLMYDRTSVIIQPVGYDEIIFENGQGLLLNDTGRDIAGTTPSKTGCEDALKIAREWNISADDIELHYVTRPYLTRHGKGILTGETDRNLISGSIEEDRTNHYNQFQDDFRFGALDLQSLKQRVDSDNIEHLKSIIEVTHCDEMDRESEFKKMFDSVRMTDSALILNNENS